MNKITMFFCTLLCLFAACTQQEDELKALEEGKKVLVSFNVPEVALTPITVSYTHLTLPTNSRV